MAFYLIRLSDRLFDFLFAGKRTTVSNQPDSGIADAPLSRVVQIEVGCVRHLKDKKM